MGHSVEIVEVGPRDGLQSFATNLPTEAKLHIIEHLNAAGLRRIEVTGFAHPAKIPRFADAEALCERLPRGIGVSYRGMAPNARGAERAIKAGIDEVVGLITASATYLRKNQNMTFEQAIDQAAAAFRLTDKAGKPFTMAVGMAFWCAYEGPVPEDRVLGLLQRFRAGGITRCYLAATVGLESPDHVERVFARAYDRHPDIELGFHVHNLGGRAPVLAWSALGAGARWIEGAICGIGGGIAMPENLAAVGNYATEDLVSLLADSGVDTGLDVDRVIAASRKIAAFLGIAPRSFAASVASRGAVRTLVGRPDVQDADTNAGGLSCRH